MRVNVPGSCTRQKSKLRLHRPRYTVNYLPSPLVWKRWYNTMHSMAYMLRLTEWMQSKAMKNYQLIYYYHIITVLCIATVANLGVDGAAVETSWKKLWIQRSTYKKNNVNQTSNFVLLMAVVLCQSLSAVRKIVTCHQGNRRLQDVIPVYLEFHSHLSSTALLGCRLLFAKQAGGWQGVIGVPKAKYDKFLLLVWFLLPHTVAHSPSTTSHPS